MTVEAAMEHQVSHQGKGVLIHFRDLRMLSLVVRRDNQGPGALHTGAGAAVAMTIRGDLLLAEEVVLNVYQVIRRGYRGALHPEN
mmetsp:Transcript_19838/g.48734  ORF Transcript_19838/g.48734 Transcript_19838/m.48734 type:complete len:85 (+) Transcript_19838:265-519(+)|eukprot:CAMPEP_0113620462 /NCGR_PEP_ID=MMETSP0017_2-20120614/10430_1 /TAXON_ID=2856 /ORGANISM="Cylindrotheca closterium" /LENGTH=84 /DNA_ID=CAMNT_0000530133 /DNA_START=254 /DNA_END=508 /DNA_ORIENTATION=+ /assembly_acc=CAM_ASM_000147